MTLKPLSTTALHDLLKTGPQSEATILAAGYSTTHLTARMTDLRHKIQRFGCDVLNRPGNPPTWELCVPQ